MNTGKRRSTGYSLIEVLIGIVIFAVGIMAIAQFQGKLSKSSADSVARTVASNIAEQEIERLRSFSQVAATGNLDFPGFNDIVSSNPDAPAVTRTRGNIDYTVETVVTDLYYNPATEAFQPTKPDDDIVNPDLKRVAVTVSWGAGENTPVFSVDQSQDAVDLGTGSVTLVDLISSFTTGSGAKVRLNNAAVGLYSPPVDYKPGQNPDIVSIQLGDNKFKESTTPLPDVFRTDELVETSFDVVTYSQGADGATFLRREEFKSVSCQCSLRIPSADADGGKRPTVWNGEYYSEGEFVAKPYGVSASNQQSDFCDICCRDHHDGGTGGTVAGDPGSSLYNPFRASDDYHVSGDFAGDHKHYRRDNLGNLVLADKSGDVYFEACRLVRKDGFFRVAQDLRQEGLNSFPGNFLDDTAEVEVYSDYVTDAVEGFESQLLSEAYQYETAPTPPALAKPADLGLIFPASSYATASVMSEASGVVEQQLRSRGIYIDFMSRELRCKINKLQGSNNVDDCTVPANVSNPLEMIPFYEVQLTWLSRWTETPSNNPVDVTNEAIADGNSHSRGLATLEAGFGYSAVNAAVHSGNLGLTGTDPIDPRYASEVERYNLYTKAVDPTAPPQLSGIQVNGEITSAVPGVKAADVEITAYDAQCDRTLTGFKCFIEEGAADPRIRVDNYFKLGKLLYACSPELENKVKERSVDKDIPNNNYAIFSLPTTISTNVSIVIKEGGC